MAALRLAVIGTFYRRPWAVPRIAAAMRAQTRKPNELWLIFEEAEDYTALRAETWGLAPTYLCATVPRDEQGKTTQVPPSVGINHALDAIGGGAVAYLTDDSLPHPDKYARMLQDIEKGANAVYCAQSYGKAANPEEWLARIGGEEAIRTADGPQPDPFCQVDHTQVMHRYGDDRWPLDMETVRWADGVFFRDLVARFGPLAPVPQVLDYTLQLPDGISGRT